jgi:acyl-CoA synthetase (AMP-forming)/AMP-acid ligase II
VPTTGTNPDPDELRTWARDQMANFKVPREFEIVSELPLNPTGKVLKYVLRERATGGR